MVKVDAFRHVNFIYMLFGFHGFPYVRSRMNGNHVLLMASITVALIIMADFILPGKEHVEEVTEVERTFQRAHRKSYHTYSIHTNNHYFDVSERFGLYVEEGMEVHYKTSLLFKQVNRYGEVTEGETYTYSLRWLTGLLFPLAAIIIFAMGFRYYRRMDVLVLVTQVLVVADIVYLTWNIF